MPVIYIVVIAALAAVLAIVLAVSKLKEQAGAFGQISRELLQRLQALEERVGQTEETVRENLTAMRREQREDARSGREEQTKGVAALGDTQAKRIKEIGDMQRESLESFSQQLTNISRLNEEKLEAMRATVEEKILALQKGNEEKLEKMRKTVDEQLHETLEKRLGEAFSSVSERLEQVHKGLGEMKALTSDVGDLKKVLSNVKVRGTWGEMQLGSILEQMLTREQYAQNVRTKPDSKENVEFAIILPGKDEGMGNVYLPVDSKFPLEDYQRLVEASANADKEAVERARKELSARVLEEAKTIKTKYIEPPYTTDFGILYLPIEGLYAEVLQINGLCERLSREFRVTLAGPTTFTALLNSLQMGFRTLALEKRSSEVWILLGQVRTEFEKFGAVLAKTKQKIEQAGKELEQAEVRTRAINRRLRNVEKSPLPEGALVELEDQFAAPEAESESDPAEEE